MNSDDKAVVMLFGSIVLAVVLAAGMYVWRQHDNDAFVLDCVRAGQSVAACRGEAKP